MQSQSKAIFIQNLGDLVRFQLTLISRTGAGIIMPDEMQLKHMGISPSECFIISVDTLDSYLHQVWDNTYIDARKFMKENGDPYAKHQQLLKQIMDLIGRKKLLIHVTQMDV